MGQGQINPLVLYVHKLLSLRVTVYLENTDFFFFSKSVFTYEKLIFFLPKSLFTYKILKSAMVLEPSSPLGLMLLCRDSGLIKLQSVKTICESTLKQFLHSVCCGHFMVHTSSVEIADLSCTNCRSVWRFHTFM